MFLFLNLTTIIYIAFFIDRVIMKLTRIIYIALFMLKR